MKINSRRIFVWLISFLVVIVVYKLYAIFNQTPIIDLERTTTFLEQAEVVDSNSSEQIGKIGGVEIERIDKARFFDKNPETGEIEREFGYEMVANVQGSEWEIIRPYMNVYRPDLNLRITAEKGNVFIEDAAGRPSLSDATLRGNVIIHINPKENSNIAEGFLYLNDIIFISDQSKATSSGPVRFVSGNARFNGRGMELVYNDELNRLEFLRIVQLESLRIRSEETSLLSSQEKKKQQKSSPDNSSYSKPSQDISAPKSDSSTVKTGVDGEEQFYRCIFNKNVEVQTPGQIISADKISINNIINLSDNSAQTASKEENKSSTEHKVTNVIDSDTDQNHGISSNDVIEVIVTCDGGIVVIPSEYGSIEQLNTQPESFFGDFVQNKSEELNKSGQVTTYVASTLDYFVESGDTIALGPSELTFYIEDLFEAAIAIPAKITAKKKVIFMRSENKVVFEGDCICSMTRVNEGIEEQYTLKAPRITINLFRQDMSSSDIPTNLDSIFADGGIVRLSTINKYQGELLGGVELKCERFDYFAQEQYLVASGPGVINVDNSKAKESAKNINRLSLQRRCYARVENFDTLTYFLESNWFVAKAGVHQMFLGYVPVLDDGKSGQPTRAYTGIVEAYLQKTVDERLDIKKLKAQQGVIFETEDIQFEGNEMLYNPEDSLVFVRGSESTPCKLNGADVDGIEYDLKTEKVKAKIVAPGMFQLSR
ncbi:MAG: hypothetical protein ACYTFM_02245 [Planctomycetota bacterium]|jgi:hypothetical protein